MTSYPYKNQQEIKDKLEECDWILFQENSKNKSIFSGEIITINKKKNTIIVCTDIDTGFFDDFNLNDIILHIESSWENFNKLADIPYKEMMAG